MLIISYMDRTAVFGFLGCVIATLISMYYIQFRTNGFFLILIPMWGLVMGVAVGRVVDVYDEKPKKKK